MKGIFLSHSSIDKPEIFRIAKDLVFGGINIWFDQWELELGDSLTKKIFQGIERSFFMVLVLSVNSVKSKWVIQELKAAIKKEQEINRKFIVPIIISDCTIPKEVSGRIYADFTKGYQKSIRELINFFKKHDALNKFYDTKNITIPLVFHNQLDIDLINFKKVVNRIREADKLNSSNSIEELNSSNLFIFPDNVFISLRQKIDERYNNIENDIEYSQEFLNEFTASFDKINTLEEKLTNVFLTLIKNWDIIRVGLNDVIIWTGKLLRSQILYHLYTMQNHRHDADLIQLEESVNEIAGSGYYMANPNIWLDPRGPAARFYKINEVKKCRVQDINGLNTGDYFFKFWLDIDSVMYDRLTNVLNNNYDDSYDSVMDSKTYSKFMIPQMLVRNEEQDYIWDWSDKYFRID